MTEMFHPYLQTAGGTALLVFLLGTIYLTAGAIVAGLFGRWNETFKDRESMVFILISWPGFVGVAVLALGAVACYVILWPILWPFLKLAQGIVRQGAKPRRPSGGCH